MNCAHCRHFFHEVWYEIYLGPDRQRIVREVHSFGRTVQVTDPGWTWIMRKVECPKCERLMLKLRKYEGIIAEGDNELSNPDLIKEEQWVLPKSPLREPLPEEVPSHFVQDYQEALLVLDDSPKEQVLL